MAKIQFGGGVAAISGRVAGTVFARNKGGAYMRRFSVPTNPQSAGQQARRQTLASASSAWRNLDTDQQAAWAAWALTHPITDRLGQAVALTGSQAHVAINALAVAAGVGAVYTLPPPEPTYKTPVLSGGITALTNASIVLKAGVDLAAEDRLLIWACPPVSPGITNTNAMMRLAAVVVLAAPVAVGADLPDIIDDVKAAFGDLDGTDGKRMTFQGQFYHNGQASQRSTATGIISALPVPAAPTLAKSTIYVRVTNADASPVAYFNVYQSDAELGTYTLVGTLYGPIDPAGTKDWVGTGDDWYKARSAGDGVNTKGLSAFSAAFEFTA